VGQAGPNANEVTSIDPGNVPGGLFWTVPIPANSVQVDVNTGIATYQVRNLATLDFHDFYNDANHGPAIPTTLSFTVRWGGMITDRQRIVDSTNHFRGDFVFNTATVVWSAFEPTRPSGPTRFVSDPATTSHSDFAVVGHERNGVFF
jgi:hypothetical protein